MNLYVYKKHNKGVEDFVDGTLVVEAKDRHEAETSIVEFLHGKLVGRALDMFPTVLSYWDDFLFMFHHEEEKWVFTPREYRSNVWVLVYSVQIRDWNYDKRIGGNIIAHEEYFGE